jgi:hypothetical protein
MQNAVEALAGGGGGRGVSYLTGVPITLDPSPGASEVVVKPMASGEVAARAPVTGPRVTLPAISRAGVYEVSGVAATSNRVAVNLLNELESDCRSRDKIVVNADRRVADTISGAVPRELWPWFVGAVLALLGIEWMMWLRRSVA